MDIAVIRTLVKPLILDLMSPLLTVPVCWHKVSLSVNTKETEWSALCSVCVMALVGHCWPALNTVCAAMTRYIAVENHDTSRVICSNVNGGQGGTLTPDHTWASSVDDITEQRVKDLGAGNVRHCCFGPPCKDHSKLRLIPRSGSKSKMTRLGL